MELNDQLRLNVYSEECAGKLYVVGDEKSPNSVKNRTNNRYYLNTAQIDTDANESGPFIFIADVKNMNNYMPSEAKLADSHSAP